MFHDLPIHNIIKKLRKKKPKVISFQKRGVGVQGGMIMISDSMVFFVMASLINRPNELRLFYKHLYD